MFSKFNCKFVATTLCITLLGICVAFLVKINNTSLAIHKQLSAQTKSQLVTLLKTYSASDHNGPLKLIRHGRDHDGGYVAPEKALLAADVLMGYGIADDASFEDDFSIKYNKPSYGFDCGVESVEAKSKLFTFKSECIANDNFLYLRQKSSQKISSFNEQIQSLGLENKKIFIKMDIEGAEYDAFDDILSHRKNITGIVLEIHFYGNTITDAVRLLSNLNHDFILTHMHANNCVMNSFKSGNAIGSMPYVLELTYINKNLVDSYSASPDQTHPTNLDMPNCKDKKEYQFEILSSN